MNSSFRVTQFSSPGRWIWSRASMSWKRNFRQQDIVYIRGYSSVVQFSQVPNTRTEGKVAALERGNVYRYVGT